MKICKVRIRRKYQFIALILLGLFYINNNLLQKHQGKRFEKFITCSKSRDFKIKQRHLDTSNDDVIDANNVYDEPDYTGPVDLVYLWVNGSDPKFVLDLKRQKAIDNGTMNELPLQCKSEYQTADKFSVVVVYPALPNIDGVTGNENVKSIFNITHDNIKYSVVLPKLGHRASNLVYMLIEIDGQYHLPGCGYITSAAELVFDPNEIYVYGTPKSNRFADNDQLLYSLRSVEMYAPWIRHIFIVTNDQVPNWLNTSYPKVTVKSTAEIFPNKADLPTFSSPAIESHVHRIPELSETFLLSCDDFFFGGPVRLSHFYTPESGLKIIMDPRKYNCAFGCSNMDLGNGVCDSWCNTLACGWDYGDCGTISPQKMTMTHPISAYGGSLFRTMALFNRKYKLTKRYSTPPHLPILINKKIATALEKRFREEFKESSSFHFRSPFNIQYTMAYLEFVMNERVSMTTEEFYDDLEKDVGRTSPQDIFQEFQDRTGSHEVFCTTNTEITKLEFLHCECIKDIMKQANITRPKYKHELTSSWDRHFIIIRNGWMRNQLQLLWLRRFPSTFNAINDNIHHEKENSKFIQQQLREFFEDLFPKKSNFERTDL